MSQRLRRRRRRSLLPSVLGLVVIALVLFVLVGGIARTGRSSGPYLASIDRSFAAQAAVLAQQSNLTASDLRAVLIEAPGVSRPELRHLLDALVSATRSTEQQAIAISDPAPAGNIGGTLIAAMTTRMLAMERLRSTLQGLLGIVPIPASRVSSISAPVSKGPSSPAQAVAGIMQVGELLSQADRGYAVARSGLIRSPGHARIPRSAWVRDPGSFGPAAASSLVGGALSSPTLAPKVHVKISAVRIVPPVTPPALLEIPPTHKIMVTAVVDNDGNVDIPALTVAARIQTGSAASTVRVVTPIRAGSAVSIRMPALKVSPGVTYQLTVSIDAPRGQNDPTGLTAPPSTIVVGQALPHGTG